MTSLEALLIAIIGAFLVAIGLTALAVSSLRGWSRDRAAPSFGVFVLLYGIRLLCRSPLVWETTGLPETWFRFTDSWITYAIFVPASMFVEAVAAPPYRIIARRLWQFDLAYAALAIAADIALRRPGSMLWMNPIAVVTHFSFWIGVSDWFDSDELTRPFAAPIPASARRDNRLNNRRKYFRRSCCDTRRFFCRARSRTSIHSSRSGCLPSSLDSDTSSRNARSKVSNASSLSRKSWKRRAAFSSPFCQRMTPSVAGLQISASYMPMTEVAGDFYDFLDEGDGRVGILVADVSGHGVPAALIASMVKIAFAAQADHASDPARVITGMNHALCGKFELAYVTATYAFIDPTRRVLEYASAGHPPILLLRASGEIKSLEEGGLLLAFTPAAVYSNVSVPMNSGDRLLLYTDGLIEAADARDAFFGDERLAESLRGAAALDLPDLVAHLTDRSECLARIRLATHR